MVDILTSYVWPEDRSEHIIYIDADRQIRELFRMPEMPMGQWNPTNPTMSANAPLASAFSMLTGYVWPNDRSEHVIYISPDNHIQQLWYMLGSGQWKFSDLSNETLYGLVPPTPGSALASTSAELFESVFYVGLDSHVHKLTYSRDPRFPETEYRWAHEDLMAAVNAPLVYPGSPLVAFVSPNYSSEPSDRVFYIGMDLHVHEIVFQWVGSYASWQHIDLTAQTGAPVAVAGSALTGVMRMETGTENLFFVDENYQIRQIRYLPQTNQWAQANIFQGTPAPAVAVGAPLTSFTSPITPFLQSGQPRLFGPQQGMLAGLQQAGQVGPQQGMLAGLQQAGQVGSQLAGRLGQLGPGSIIPRSGSQYGFLGDVNVAYVDVNNNISLISVSEFGPQIGTVHTNLSALTGAPLPLSTRVITSYIMPEDISAHVVYVSGSNLITELRYSAQTGQWNANTVGV